ncbi:MAG TPA: hypothetical protein VJ728_12860, partial [Candidatus Binataceae bacterium]|nr:hypothetical protein [Candidatus Binataceae bacterium]
RLHVIAGSMPPSGDAYWGTDEPLGTAFGSAVSGWTDLNAMGNVIYDPSNIADSSIDVFTSAYPGETDGAFTVPVGCSEMPTSNFPCFTGVAGDTSQQNFPISDWKITSHSSHYLYITTNPAQDELGWVVIIDVGTSPASVIAAFPTWANFINRYGVYHTEHQVGDTTWRMTAYQNLSTSTAGADKYNGPFASNLAANATSMQTFICVDSLSPSQSDTGTVGATLNQISNFQIDDVAFLGANSNPSGEEQVAVTSVSASGANCSGGPEVDVVRGVLGTTPTTHTTSEKMWAKRFVSSIYRPNLLLTWNFIADPYGDLNGSKVSNLFWAATSPSNGICTFSSTCNSQPNFEQSGHMSYANGYSLGESNGAVGSFQSNDASGSSSTPMASPGALSSASMYAIKALAPFAGHFAGNSSTGPLGNVTQAQAHPAAPQYNAANAVQGSFEASDEPTLNGPTGTFGCAATPVLVTGTLWSCVPKYAWSYTFGAPEVYDGAHVFMDVSGPASTIGGSTADSYKFCFAYLAGECQSGSLQGTLYMNDPNWTSAPAACSFNNNRGGGAFDFDFSDQACPGMMYGDPQTAQEIALLGSNDFLFQYRRVLTTTMSRWNYMDGFATAHIFGDGRWMWFVTQGFTDGQGTPSPREDTFIAQVPSWATVSAPQYDYVPVMITVPAEPSALGVSTAMVEFGYDPLTLHCSSFNDVCISVNSALNDTTPFNFETDDTYTKAPCASGCVLAIPTIPNSIVFYRVKLFDTGGSLVETLPTQVAAVP